MSPLKQKQRQYPVPLEAEQMSVSELKARCLGIVESVRSRGRRFVITKHGIPVAQILPLNAQLPSPTGKWKGRIKILGDIVQNDWSEEFEALSD